MPCREHLSQLRQHSKLFEQANVEIKIVTFDADFLAKAYIREQNIRWPLLLDPEKIAYRAYQMESGSWWQVANPVTIARYVRQYFGGQRPGKSGSDWRQLGGDVLIDPLGIIRLHFVSHDPHDRPSPSSLLSIVSQSTLKTDESKIHED